MLRRFHARGGERPWRPTAVEQEFAFERRDATRVQGRYDLVVEEAGEVTVLDFKTGDVRRAKTAEQRARESLQLDIYALAYQRSKGRLPERVELRFLETGLAASRRPTVDEAVATESRIRAGRARHQAARVRRTSYVLGLRPVPVPGDLPPHRAGRARGV